MNIKRRFSLKTTGIILGVYALILISIATYFINQDAKNNENFLPEIKEVQKILEENPDYVELYSTLGWLYYQAAIDGSNKTYLKASEEHYKKAIRHNPDHVGNYFSLALVLEEMGRTRDAKKEFEKVVELDPAYSIAYYHLAQLSNISEAVHFLETLLTYEPTAGNVYYELGLMYEQQGKVKNALEMYEFSLRYIPNLEEAKKRMKELSNR